MDPIYVTGHRNPDTDSIVAAMAYAALRNNLGDREYEAACLGRVSDETQMVLDRFGFQPPKRITSMHTQVRDLEFDKPPVFSAAVTMDRAWAVLHEHGSASAIPIANDDGTLYGMLSRDEIANYNMSLVTAGKLDSVPLFNVLSVLEGKILNDAGENIDTVSGEVSIALPQRQENLLFNRPDSIVLVGHQPDMIRRALEMNVNCLVLCQAELSEDLRSFPTSTCIISTPHDAYRAARLLFQSTPIGRICNNRGLICFHLDDRVDDVREAMLKHRYSSYPILDEDERVVGVLSRYHLLRPRRKRVVLVDHNEASQSVPGLEEAEILDTKDNVILFNSDDDIISNNIPSKLNIDFTTTSDNMLADINIYNKKVDKEKSKENESKETSTSYKATYTMEATAYTGDSITATGTTPIRNEEGLSTIAVDPSVIPLGSKVYIPGYGEAIASDTGSAIKGNKIDLFFNSKDECAKWGRQNVTLYILEYPGE